MPVAVLALLAASLAADPLPDNKTPIDSLTYAFGGGGIGIGAGGSLTISKDGKVGYFYSSAPHTGSGGRVVQQKWELSKEEVQTLFRKLVEDGLLEADAGLDFSDCIRVTHGRWRATFATESLPAKAMAHLRPLLAKADPGMWGEKKPAKLKEPAAKPGVLTWLNYHYSTKMDGDHISLFVFRDGKVRYVHRSPTDKLIDVEWTIPAKDAETLLDTLAAEGLLDLEDGGADKFTNYMIDAAAGKWRITIRSKDFPEKLLKPMLPLMKKVDAAFWK